MADDYAVSRGQLGTLAHVIRTGFEVESENERLRNLCSELFVLANDGLMELDDQEFERIYNEAKALGVGCRGHIVR